MRIILRTGVLILAAGMGSMGLTACSTGSGPGAAANGRIRAVVAENFWGSIVSQLAGSDAVVTSIISNPATDPHDYEPTAADARAIASAQFVVVNGIGYDSWAQKLLDADPEPGRLVLDVGKVLHLHAGANPHQWYSPASVRRVIAAVAGDFARIDPRHGTAYQARERTYVNRALRTYRQLLASIRDRFAGTPIGASESIVGPLAESLRLRMVTPEPFLDAIAEGNEPTEAQKAAVDAEIADRRIKVFVYNEQNATPDVQRLVDAARRHDIPVTTVTETLVPANATFQSWQAGELRALLAALEQARRP